jgi:hypothetical protein
MTARDPFAAEVCPACKPKRDAMRLARAEDHRSCARLTARVKELEAEVASLRRHDGGRVTVRGAYSCADEHAWVQGNDPIFQVCNRCPAERVMPLAKVEQLAEGTRDEKAARCGACKVPCAVTSQHGLCGMCESERRCRCPPGVFMPTSLASRRCATCGGART